MRGFDVFCEPGKIVDQYIFKKIGEKIGFAIFTHASKNSFGNATGSNLVSPIYVDRLLLRHGIERDDFLDQLKSFWVVHQP